jgi:hypothetical protein
MDAESETANGSSATDAEANAMSVDEKFLDFENFTKFFEVLHFNF